MVGEISYATVIDSYAQDAIDVAGPENMGFVIPEGLSIFSGDGIGVLKGAPHRLIAEQFVQFVLSEEGQRLVLYKKGAPGGPKEFLLRRLPVLPELYEESNEFHAITLNPFLMKPAFRFDPEKGASRWTTINDLLGAFILDKSERWRALRKVRGETLLSSFHFPVSEDEARDTAVQGVENSTEVRARFIEKWSKKSNELLQSYGTSEGGSMRWEGILGVVFLGGLLVYGVTTRIRRF